MKYILYAVITALLIALLLTCNSSRQKDKEISDLHQTAFYDSLLTKKLDSVQNRLGQVVSSQQVAEINSRETIGGLFSEVFQLKKQDEARIKEVQSLVRLVQKASVRDVYVPYTPSKDSLPAFAHDSMVPRDLVVIPPKSFSVNSAYYSLSGKVLLKGVKIDSLSFSDTSSVAIVRQSQKGFFKKLFGKNEVVVKSVHSNPYMRDYGIQTVTLKEKKSAWDRFIKPLLSAAAASYITYRVVK